MILDICNMKYSQQFDFFLRIKVVEYLMKQINSFCKSKGRNVLSIVDLNYRQHKLLTISIYVCQYDGNHTRIPKELIFFNPTYVTIYITLLINY